MSGNAAAEASRGCPACVEMQLQEEEVVTTVCMMRISMLNIEV